MTRDKKNKIQKISSDKRERLKRETSLANQTRKLKAFEKARYPSKTHILVL